MKTMLCSLGVAVLALSVAAAAQEKKKETPKAETTKATFEVKGLH